MKRMRWVFALPAVIGVLAHAGELPPYTCNPPQAGRGQALEAEVEQRIAATRARPAAEAIAELETMAEAAPTGSYLDGVLAFERAWRYMDDGRAEPAAEQAHRVLRNEVVEGARIDQMRAVLAQLARDSQRWPEVVEALQPVVEQQCRPVPDTYRYLLAEAYVHLDDTGAALVQIDAAEPADDAEGIGWMRAALAHDCAGEPAASCAVRVLRYAQTPGPSAGLQALVNDYLATLSGVDAHRPMLEQARAAGLLDERYRLIPRAPKTLSELKPIKRVAPTYPQAAIRRGQQGYVELELTVGPTGKVIGARVVDSSPPGVFDAAALRAASQARFQPATADGEPVETTGRYTVQFKLR